VQIGHELAARGDLREALDVYRDSLVITKTLASKDPSNALWQRDLSISLERLGDVLKSQREYLGALKVIRIHFSFAENW
jgi:hypothetical protein